RSRPYRSVCALFSTPGPGGRAGTAAGGRRAPRLPAAGAAAGVAVLEIGPVAAGRGGDAEPVTSLLEGDVGDAVGRGEAAERGFPDLLVERGAVDLGVGHGRRGWPRKAVSLKTAMPISAM